MWPWRGTAGGVGEALPREILAQGGAKGDLESAPEEEKENQKKNMSAGREAFMRGREEGRNHCYFRWKEQ